MKVVNRPRAWNFDIEGAPEAHISVAGPDLSDGLNKFNISDIKFSDGASVEGVEIAEGRPERLELKSLSLKKSVFRNVAFIEASVKKLDAGSVRFDHCDFSNAALSGAVVHRCEFVNCKMLGANFTEAVFRNVLFRDCKCDYAFFSFASFKHAGFENCSLAQSDFQRAQASKFLFCKCDLTAGQFSGFSFRGMDISDCEIEGVIAGPDELRGATIASHQAVQLAGIFGMNVRA